MSLTRDLFAIAKFLFDDVIKEINKYSKNRPYDCFSSRKVLLTSRCY